MLHTLNVKRIPQVWRYLWDMTPIMARVPVIHEVTQLIIDNSLFVQIKINNQQHQSISRKVFVTSIINVDSSASREKQVCAVDICYAMCNRFYYLWIFRIFVWSTTILWARFLCQFKLTTGPYQYTEWSISHSQQDS